MTTTVVIAVQGNQPVEVKTSDGQAQLLQPGQWTTRYVHGDGVLSVCEKPAQETPPTEAQPG